MTYTTMTNLTTGDMVTETIWDNQVQGNIEHLLSRVEPTLTNKSGSSQSAGAVVVTDNSNDSAFTTTTTVDDEDVLGVVQQTIANDATGRVLVSGVVTVNVQGNVTRGDFIRTSATAGRGESAGTTRTSGSFAQAMTTYSGGGAGTVTAVVLNSYSSYSGGVGSATWGGNLIKNFPSMSGINGTATDGTQPMWWTEASANVTLTEEDATGEAIAQKYERVLKIVQTSGGSANAAYQTLTYADENLLDAGQTAISAGVWIYNTTAGTVTLNLQDDNAGSLGTGTTTTENSWVFLSVSNVTLGNGSSLNLQYQLYHSGAGTFYATMPALHVGSIARPWQPRRLRYVEKQVVDVLTENPGDTGWANVDFNSDTSNNTAALSLKFWMQTATGGAFRGFVRVDGSATGQTHATVVASLTTTSGGQTDHSSFILCDENQIIEESVSSSNVTVWAIPLAGYWEWE